MNRRTALGWIGTSVMAAVVDPLSITAVAKTDPVIDYSVFCDAGTIRFNLANPFNVAGRVYGTDARILVTQQSFECDATDQLRLPPVDALPWDHFETAGWGDLWKSITDHTQSPDLYECDLCDGVGVNYTTGVVCKKCKGCGRMPIIIERCQIDGRKYDFEYIKKLQQCGDVEFKTIHLLAKGPRDTPCDVIAFRFGQTGRGFLCSMLEDGE